MSKFSRKEWQTKVKKLSKSSLFHLCIVICDQNTHTSTVTDEGNSKAVTMKSGHRLLRLGNESMFVLKVMLHPAQLVLSQFIYYSLPASSLAHLLTQLVLWAFSLIFPFFPLMLNHLGSSIVQGFDLPACRAFVDIFQCQHIFLQQWEHGNTLACFH